MNPTFIATQDVGDTCHDAGHAELWTQSSCAAAPPAKGMRNLMWNAQSPSTRWPAPPWESGQYPLLSEAYFGLPKARRSIIARSSRNVMPIARASASALLSFSPRTIPHACSHPSMTGTTDGPGSTATSLRVEASSRSRRRLSVAFTPRLHGVGSVGPSAEPLWSCTETPFACTEP